MSQVAAARQAAGPVTTLAGGRKPSMLASKKSKDAYKLLQDNGTRAQAIVTELDQVATSAASTNDRGQLTAASAKVTELKSELARLHASSKEAAGGSTGAE